MKLGIVALQVALTGGGILVYDMVRRPDAAVPAHDAAPAPREISRTDEPRSEQPVLSGPGLEDAFRRIAALEARAPTASPSSRSTSVVPGDDGDAADGETGTPLDPELSGIVDVGDPTAPRFDERTIRQFRALLDEAERRRSEERRREAIKGQLDRLELRLTPEQTDAVITTTMKFREKAVETFRDMGRGDPAERERRAAMREDLRQELGRSLEAIVPSADAQKIVEAMGRAAGLARFDRTRGGGLALPGNARDR
jgi:hypothetical protein